MPNSEGQSSRRDDQPVRLESGHFYGPEHVTSGYDVFDMEGKSNPAEREVRNDRIEQGLKLGAQIEELLLGSNFAVERILFHDDVDMRIEQSGSVDAWRYQLFLGRAYMTALDRTKLQSKSPVKLEQEFNYIEPGNQLIEELKKAASSKEGWRLSEDGKKLICGSGAQRQRIELVGFLEHQELPSCEVLDMVAYRKKIWGSKGTITVLPESYRAQQERVKKLFEIFDEAPPIILVYHDNEGKPTSIDEWNPKYTESLGVVIRKGLINGND